MLNYYKVIENSSALNILKRDLDSNRLSHAYLFISQDENYLKSFCEYVCKLLINQKEQEKQTINSVRIDKHIHPDVKIFGDEKAIDVKVATELVEESDYSPFEADKKIFVILNAQDMNDASQNKILKTIEEPPRNTYFILTATRKNGILPTILSRVKEIELEEISFDLLTEMLQETGINLTDAEIISSCSSGNATFAEKIALSQGFIDFYKNIVSMFVNLDGSKDVIKYSVMFNDKKVDKNEFFDISAMLIRDAIFIHSKNENLIINKNVIEKLSIIAKKLNINSLLELNEMCNRCKQMLAFNVNSTAVIDEFLYKIAEVKVRCRRLWELR